MTILALSMGLLALLKSREARSLSPYFKADKTLSLSQFREARSKVSKDEIDLLELWESILTGRSAPLSKMMKENYKSLGLNHIFTPSGFHLSAVLLPFMKLIKIKSWQLAVLFLIGGGLCFLPGLGALKRMVLIKFNQKLVGLHLGFITALTIDILFGTFQNNTLSFTYSFLFIGIIYSGLSGIRLIIWFFVAQVIIAYFQNNSISILLLLFSPMLNIVFALVMPILFLLSFPLWSWQLKIGLFALGLIQDLVNFCAGISFQFPVLETNIVLLGILFLIIFSKFKYALVLILIFSTSLNVDRGKAPGTSRYEFVPMKPVIKVVYREKENTVFFRNGRCKLKMVNGLWWERCFPKKRVPLARHPERFKKLSCLFEEQQMSSLHG